MSNDETPPVGRNKPPKEHQFGPDHPGNRRGRPKGSRNVKTIVQEFAQNKARCHHRGRRCKLSTAELLLETLKTLAMNGDYEADRHLERLRDRLRSDIDRECRFACWPGSLVARRVDQKGGDQQSVRQEAELQKALGVPA